MTDNLPDRREEDLPDITRASGVSFHSSGFYQRSEADETPQVNGRRLKPHRACKVCTMVPKLMDRAENPYTFHEAVDAETDLYRFIYTFWSASDISRWLKRTHEYDVAHDSISRHISSHCPDPNLAMLDRVKSYQPDFMQKRFFLGLADTMKLSVMKYQAHLATGEIPLSTAEFLQVAKMLKEWQEFLGELQKDDTDKMMQAVGKAMNEVLDPHPELKEQFMLILKQELEKIDKEEGEGY